MRAILLAAFALLVALRLPAAWPQGRLLGEEGPVFLAYAWHRPALDALFHAFGGYLNIAANAVGLATARLVRGGVLPLEYAPWLTMTVALAFQLLPAVLILGGHGLWTPRRWATPAALALVALAPLTEEVFLNTLHIQFHLALCAALILALSVPRSRGGRAGYGAILFLAPLCGPGAIVVLPLFVVRALVDRERGRIVQTAVFAAGAAIQLAIFFSPSPVRGELLDPVTLASVLAVRAGALPVLGARSADVFGHVIYESRAAGGIGGWLAAAVAIGYFGGLLALAMRDLRDGAAWLLAAGLLIAAVSFGGGMIALAPRDWFVAAAGERYNFVPLALLGLGTLTLAARTDRRFRPVTRLLVAATLVSGAAGYPRPIEELARGPAWRAEVAGWRRDRDRPLRGWPAGWTIDLSDADRPCPPPRALAAAPSYCESAWLLMMIEKKARIARQG